MQQALRPAPIETPTALLGRLAVLAAGTSQQRRFEEQIADARARFSAGISSADPAARIAAIQGGLGSSDSEIAGAARALLPLTTPKDKIVATPGGGSSVVPMVGEQVAGEPRVLVQGRGATPQVIRWNDGEREISLLYDPTTDTATRIGDAPRATLDRGRTEEAERQDIRIAEARGAATGTAIGTIAAQAQARAQAASDVKVAERQAAQERYRDQAREKLGEIEQLIAEAGPAGAISPQQADRIEGLRTAAAIAIARAQSENPDQEPNDTIIKAFAQMIPGNVKGAAGMTGGLDTAFALVGGRPKGKATDQATDKPKPVTELSDDELIEEARRLGVGR
ncbi:MAG: hypothetical protein AB7F51_12875 [Pseudorhodoplanes sp.]